MNRPNFPAVPPSLNAGDHEMRDYYSDGARIAPHTAPSITPYLGLRARLSQVWINRWTVLLLLVLARTLIFVTSLDHDLDSARTEALAACSSVESVGSAMASMPHYLSQGTNELAATGVEKAVNGLMSMLLLSVTGVEELIVFVVNMLTSTYTCLITLAISGSLHVALSVIKDVSDFVNKTLVDVTGGLKKDINSFQDDLNKFGEVLNSVPKIFGKSDTIPVLDLSSDIDKITGIVLPSSLDQGLTELNNSIPTFAQVQNFTDNVLREPFKIVKGLMNDSMKSYSFNRSVFPVPQKEQLKFCSGNNGINNFFDDLVAVANTTRKIFIIVLILLALLVMIPMGYREIWRWRSMQQRAQLINKSSHDPIDVVQIAAHPYTSTAGMKVASFAGTSRRQLLVRWFFAYITSPAALFVLTLGLAGLAACLCQFILLKAVAKETPAIGHQVGQFAGEVVNKLNNASEKWADGVNGVIGTTNKDINQEVLGWVNTTTSAVNDTLNAFADQMSDALNVTFGGTVLYDPITEVLNCLIGLKIAGIQKGLTWVSDNARVDFPLLPNNTFSLGAMASLATDDPSSLKNTDSFLASPSDAASDKISSAIVKVLERIQSAIRTEALISTAVICVWLAIVLIGLFRALFAATCGRSRTRAEGGDNWADFNDPGPAPHEMVSRGAMPPPHPSTNTTPTAPPRLRIFTPDHPAPAYDADVSPPHHVAPRQLLNPANPFNDSAQQHQQPQPPLWGAAPAAATGHGDEEGKLGYAGQRSGVTVGGAPVGGNRASEYGYVDEKR